jgi:hypothetical protein
MALTVNDLAERLRVMDEITVMELLDISSEELVDRFGDFIEAKYDVLIGMFDDVDEEEDGEGSLEF